MAVTNYHVVMGMVIGETTNGVRTDYMRDALGSVTGTTVSGVVQNTYRWKPYGGLLAKTGTAADPKFQWNGGWGYRTTGRTHSDQYARARHLGSADGAWTCADTLWPRVSLYAYAIASPVTFIDPSGMLACATGKLPPRTVSVSFPAPNSSQVACGCEYDTKEQQIYIKMYKPIQYTCTAAMLNSCDCDIYQYVCGTVLRNGSSWNGVLQPCGLALQPCASEAPLAANMQNDCDPVTGDKSIVCHHAPISTTTSSGNSTNTMTMTGVDGPGLGGPYPVTLPNTCPDVWSPGYVLEARAYAYFVDFRFQTCCGCLPLGDPMTLCNPWKFTAGYNVTGNGDTVKWSGECSHATSKCTKI